MKINNFDEQYLNYLFITYIVTSKPKRISVAAGFVHMVKLLNKFYEWLSTVPIVSSQQVLVVVRVMKWG